MAKKKKYKTTKSKCKNYDVGNCSKFHCRCFDCKEYNRNKSYLDSSVKSDSRVIKINNSKETKIKKCAICNKPLNKKGWYCTTCIKKVKDTSSFLQNELNLTYPIGRSDFARLAQKYPKESDIFAFLRTNPKEIFSYFNTSKEEKKELRNRYKKEKNKNVDLDLSTVPKYIKNYFIDNEDKTFIDISGDSTNPMIKCKCNRCNKEIFASYSKLVASSCHQCDATLSKGEFLVKQYLQTKQLKFVTQFDTLKCINPQTKNILPYDFEIPKQKVIIEVQGEQHLHFTKYFHSNEEAFKYQQYKDEIKKQFAIKKGYKFIEIFYDDINNGNYKKIIDKCFED